MFVSSTFMESLSVSHSLCVYKCVYSLALPESYFFGPVAHWQLTQVVKYSVYTLPSNKI